MIFLSPDELFEQYIFHSQLLPDNPASWGLTLAHQFHASLSDDCKSSLAHSYTLPDPAGLNTKSLQLLALRTLGTLAVKEQRTLDNDRLRIERACRRMISNTARTNTTQSGEVQPTSPPTQACSLASPAEQTLKTYRLPAKMKATPEGPRPYDEWSGFVSPYSLDFQ